MDSSMEKYMYVCVLLVINWLTGKMLKRAG